MNASEATGALSAIGRLNNGLEFLETKNKQQTEQLQIAGELIKELEAHIEKIEALLPPEVRESVSFKKPESLQFTELGGD